MRVLVTGASGQLGPYLLRELEARGGGVTGRAGRRDVDLTDAGAVRDAFHHARPDVVLHTAALSKPADCYSDPQTAERTNVTATQVLAELADEAGARLIFTSTDMVYDGEKGKGLYREQDQPRPVSVYGRTKVAAEHLVLDGERNMVVRLSLLFGPGLAGARTLFDRQLAAMRAGEPVPLFEDEWRTPLPLPTAARGLADACGSDARGLFHLGGPERISRLELGRIMADAAGCDARCLQPCSRLSIASDEPRPADTSLVSDRWRQEIGADAADVGLRPVIREMLTHAAGSA